MVEVGTVQPTVKAVDVKEAVDYFLCRLLTAEEGC